MNNSKQRCQFNRSIILNQKQRISFEMFAALESGERFTIDNEIGDLNSKMVTELEIEKVSQADWGVYICKAENSIGNHESAVVLKGNTAKITC